MGAKQIVIYKCEECPHASFDCQELPEHWGKWVCRVDADGPAEYRLLTDDNVGRQIPSWCPLDDYR
jgi:hypothetical protein